MMIYCNGCIDSVIVLTIGLLNMYGIQFAGVEEPSTLNWPVG